MDLSLTNSLGFLLLFSKNIFILPYFLKDIFTRHKNLGFTGFKVLGSFLPSNTLKMSSHYLLAFIASDEKLGIFLIFLFVNNVAFFSCYFLRIHLHFVFRNLRIVAQLWCSWYWSIWGFVELLEYVAWFFINFGNLFPISPSICWFFIGLIFYQVLDVT